MNTLNIYAVGGDTVILSAGVPEAEIAADSAEIIKGDPFQAQAGFVLSTEIKIPRNACAGSFFSADCTLCFGKYLCERTGVETGTFTVSATGIGAVLRVEAQAQNKVSLSLAGKAQCLLGGAYPSVIFGGCEYFIAARSAVGDAQSLMRQLGEDSSQECSALLLLSEDAVEPYFFQKGDALCGFSAGSAALALAFYESESARDFFKATYRFPKGTREVEMKRFLSEAFDARLCADVEKRG